MMDGYTVGMLQDGNVTMLEFYKDEIFQVGKLQVWNFARVVTL